MQLQLLLCVAGMGAVLPECARAQTNNRTSTKQLFWREWPLSRGAAPPMPSPGKQKCPEGEGPVIVHGKRGDRYALGDAIGEGTFSIVYRATTESGETVAIKRLKRNLQDHTRLRDEVLALVTIGDHQCDHVVQAFDAGLKDDRLSIVMEYFQHDDFAEALQRGAFTPEHIREYMRGLLLGLRHIHGHGYIHRDIKPTNVLYNFERKHVRPMLAVLRYCHPRAPHAITRAREASRPHFHGQLHPVGRPWWSTLALRSCIRHRRQCGAQAPRRLAYVAHNRLLVQWLLHVQRVPSQRAS
jgi:hypothetical protein